MRGHKLTFRRLRLMADRHNIEISREHKSEGERYQVIQCNVPGATEYGCSDLEDVYHAIREIISTYIGANSAFCQEYFKPA